MSTISAILPTFNRAHTLGRALTSVFSQTRQPDEVIVVDDASTDATAEVVARFPQARLLRLARNGGAGHARNEGARQAKGDYFAFLDSDDLWLANKLEVQVAQMESSPDLGLACCGMTVQARSGTVTQHELRIEGPSHDWSFVEFQAYPFCPSNWLIRRSVFLEMGLFDESMPNCEDLDFLARIVGKHRIEVLPTPLTVKYNQPDSLDTHLERTAISYRILFARHKHLWKKAPAAAVRSHQRLANMYIRAGDMRSARTELLSAAQYQPWRIRFWAMAFLSLFGKAVYISARRLTNARPG